MPKAMERALKKKANVLARSGKLRKKAGETTEEAKNAMVYGTMRKTGWKPKREQGRGKSW